MEKYFKHILYDRDRVVCVLFLLELLPAEIDPVLKEKCDKKNLIRLSSFSNDKIVLILLTAKVVP